MEDYADEYTNPGANVQDDGGFTREIQNGDAGSKTDLEKKWFLV